MTQTSLSPHFKVKSRLLKKPSTLISSPNNETVKNVVQMDPVRVPEWIEAGKVIVSGFHSPLEQQVLRSAMRRGGRVVKVLARGMESCKPKREEREPMLTGNMLTVTTFPPTARRTCRAAALKRNQLVLALSEERCVPWVEPESPLREMAAERSEV